MSHKVLVGGVVYTINGGKTLIGGTSYEVSGGKTLVSGTGYNINLGAEPLIVYDGGKSVLVGSIECSTYFSMYLNGRLYQSGATEATPTFESGYIKLTSSSSAGDNFGGQGIPYTQSSVSQISIGGIDFTPYTTLSVTETYGTATHAERILGYNNSSVTTTFDYITLETLDDGYSVDISEITGVQYIRIVMPAGPSPSVTCYVSKIWLE